MSPGLIVEAVCKIKQQQQTYFPLFPDALKWDFFMWEFLVYAPAQPLCICYFTYQIKVCVTCENGSSV